MASNDIFITTLSNAGSIAFHRSLGFEVVDGGGRMGGWGTSPWSARTTGPDSTGYCS